MRPDFYVLSGMQGLKRFYVRGQVRNGEIRTMTVLYDQALDGTMGPVVVAMSSAFNPFPAASDAPTARKMVEYATGTIVSDDGAIITGRANVDDCNVITVAGFGNAARLAEDGVRELALLRLYGVRTTPLAIVNAVVPAGDVVLTGIADPQNQNGGSAVSAQRVQTATASGETTLALPIAGFSGAPAQDSAGRFAGVAVSKPDAAATLVPAAAVREFLTANGVSPASDAGDAKASVVRLICVR